MESKPGMFCRLRFTLLTSLCVAVAVAPADRIVAVVADLDRNTASAVISAK